LDKGLDEAKARGWMVVSMKDDWKTIFPLGKDENEPRRQGYHQDFDEGRGKHQVTEPLSVLGEYSVVASGVSPQKEI
jgi:hypothetical protein